MGKFAEDYDEEEFNQLMDYLHAYVDGLHITERGRRRRCVSELFEKMDHNYSGTVPYDQLLRFLQRSQAEQFHGKEWKKHTAKWAAQIKKSNTEKLEIEIEDFQGFFADLFDSRPLDECVTTLQNLTTLKSNLDS
eukprot:NODE_794_length_1446_cov_49.758769_g656_i0.p1 GENE.NODE_794_length_1446_cov_49.758769_g656_i0~~NODE_794_length_1446_cov_49.758769_g656_i0.p1  ORF type:complete len:135 (-),score=49.22 NODE_794_length_1446_cov_49.758769_g656_i0:45-449(-)